MTISVTTLGTTGNASGATLALTLGANVPAGALIVVATMEGSSSTGNGSVADTSSNTYNFHNRIAANNSAASGSLRVHYVWNATALSSGNLITYTKGTSGSTAAMTVFYATGIDISADPKDTAVSASNFGNSTGGTGTPSGTPSVSGELFVGFMGIDTGGSQRYQQDTTNNWVGSAGTAVEDKFQGNFEVGGGQQVNVGSGAITFHPTLSISSGWAEIVLGFKAATGGASALPKRTLMGAGI